MLSNGILGEAVEALEEFKEVEWPPRRAETEDMLSAVPNWMGDGRNSSGSSGHSKLGGEDNLGDEDFDVENDLALDLEKKASLSPNSGERDDEGEDGFASAAVDAAIGKEMESIDVSDEEEAKKLHQEMFRSKEEGGNSNLGADDKSKSVVQENGVTINEDSNKANNRFEAIVDEEKPMGTPQSPVPSTNNNTPTKNTASATTTVDAAAMEPMHPAIITTLHALCLVISSESKTPKMTELALECITILTNGRYVSGVAGGRMKLEVQRQLSDTIAAPKQGPRQDQTQSDGHEHVVAERLNTGAKGHDGRDGGLSFLGYVVESITRASESSSEVVQGAMAKALLAIMTCPKCGVHEAAMLQAVRSTFHVYLVGKSISGKELAKRTLVDMLKCVFMRMEAYDIVSKGIRSSIRGGETGTKDTSECSTTYASGKSAEDSTETNTDAFPTSIGIFASQYHTDSYLLFRALCKLSSKTLPGDENAGTVASSTAGLGSGVGSSATGGGFFSTTPVVDPLALSSKILSLDLILAVFEHCGDAFKNGEKFVYAVQSYLCVSLLKNCMSNQTVVAHLSLKIFLLLVSEAESCLRDQCQLNIMLSYNCFSFIYHLS
jgi:hypothetical protein